MKLEHFQEEVDGEVRWDFKKLYVQHATEQDAYRIAPRLRSADRRELAATTLTSPVRVLVDGVNKSEPSFVIKTADGTPCGLFGTRDAGYSESGVVWMLGTDDLTTNARTFLRFSRKWIDELHKKHRLLYNVIDARNEVHLNWLEWLGFECIKDIPRYGVEKRKFILFRRYV